MTQLPCLYKERDMLKKHSSIHQQRPLKTPRLELWVLAQPESDLPLAVWAEVDNTADFRRCYAHPSRPDNLRHSSFPSCPAKRPGGATNQTSPEYLRTPEALRYAQILRRSRSRHQARSLHQLCALLRTFGQNMPPIPLDNGKPFPGQFQPAAIAAQPAT